ncbi:HIT family protein [Streptomyces sp. NPDC059785]|uniref:HIT family protein n=1 Tax=unclassified Streptomyces TaxID=2593676 RepID=UPI003656D2B2
MSDGCMACDLMSGRAPLPGGTVLSTGSWVVEHCVGPLGLGTVVVKPARHVLHVADLTARETGELGPLLQRVSAAVTEVTEPEQVYVCLWSHAGGVPGHLHFVVQPVRAADRARFDAFGPALQVAMGRAGNVPETAETERVCDRLREVLGAPGPVPDPDPEPASGPGPAPVT